MSGLLDWWFRIRRVVRPPGTAATRAAVPGDIGAATATELASVFAHVDELEQELGAREAAGEREAEAILAEVEQQASRIAADGHERVTAVRADAAASRRREFEDKTRELERRTTEEAAEVRRMAAEAMPTLVADALAQVRAFAVDRGDDAAGPGGM